MFLRQLSFTGQRKANPRRKEVAEHTSVFRSMAYRIQKKKESLHNTVNQYGIKGHSPHSHHF